MRFIRFNRRCQIIFDITQLFNGIIHFFLSICTNSIFSIYHTRYSGNCNSCLTCYIFNSCLHRYPSRCKNVSTIHLRKGTSCRSSLMSKHEIVHCLLFLFISGIRSNYLCYHFSNYLHNNGNIAHLLYLSNRFDMCTITLLFIFVNRYLLFL